ncbi:MAG: hypothetical protein ACOCXJ_05535 [Planctomycetota bacterium]
MQTIPEPVSATLTAPGWYRWGGTILLAILHVIAWRLELIAVAGAIDAVLLAWLVWLLWQRRRGWATPPLAIALLALALLTTLLGLSERSWPCSIGCSNGSYYQQLWGIDLLLPAAAAYALTLLLALRDRHAATPGRATTLLIWALLGVSAFFLLLSWRLSMLCSHCLAVHGVVALLLPCVLPGRLPWPQGLGMALLAGLGLHALYHPDIVDTDAPPPEPAGTGLTTETATDRFFAASGGGGLDDGLRLPRAQQLQLLDAADSGRRFGDPQAPWRLDIVYRFECSHCVAHMDAIWHGIQDLLTAGRLQVRFIASVQQRDPTSLDRGVLVLAAASQGRFLPVCMALLAAEGVTDPSGNRARLARLPDAGRIVAVADQYRPLWEELIASDARRAALGRGRTPRLHLLRNGREQAAWNGVTDVPALLTALRARLESEQEP